MAKPGKSSRKLVARQRFLKLKGEKKSKITKTSRKSKRNKRQKKKVEIVEAIDTTDNDDLDSEHNRYVLPDVHGINKDKKSLDDLKFIIKDRFATHSTIDDNVPDNMKYVVHTTMQFEAPTDDGSRSIYDVKFFQPNYGELPSFVFGCGNKLYIFEIDNTKAQEKTYLRLTITSGNEGEEFYCVETSFVYIERTKYPVVIAAGKQKVVQVFIAHNGQHLHNLFGHSDDINEIRVSPANCEIIATVSNDETCRVFNIRHGVNLITIGGPLGHGYHIVSLDFSLCGNFIATAGSDYKVMLWKLEDGDDMSLMFGYRQKSNSDAFGEIFKKLGITNVNRRNVTLSEKLAISEKKVVNRDDLENLNYQIYKRLPFSQNRVLHSTIVDGIRFYGNYLLSKDQSKILSMWKFGTHSDDISGNSSYRKPQSSYTILKHFIMPQSNTTWFHKFEIDPSKNILAVASSKGLIYLYDIKKRAYYQQPNNVLSHTFKKTKDGVRNVTFSHDSRYLISVGNDYTVTIFNLQR
uniref:WD_REPEATS_REGION domain-containing protein n=1 Tax=Parastrongyloides trichosuri TaxID=131310 RepID=A0A0N4ZCJ5_PARTI